MTVEIDKNTKYLGKLKIGHVFTRINYPDDYYIKTDKQDEEGNIICVNLETGKLKKYAKMIQVIPVELHCIIT